MREPISPVDSLVAFLRARYGMAAQGAAALPHAIGNIQSLWSPDRLLADVDAKLRIVGLMEVVIEGYDRRHNGGRPTKEHPSVRRNAEMTLRLLARPFADHRDYRAEWAVD